MQLSNASRIDLLGADPLGDGFDLRQLVDVLRRHWRLLVALVVAAALAALAVAEHAIPTYRSTASLLIETQRSSIVSIEGLVGLDEDQPGYFETQLELLRSRSLAKRVIESLSLWDNPELDGTVPGLLERGLPGRITAALRKVTGRGDGATFETSLSVGEAGAAGSGPNSPGPASAIRDDREDIVDRFLERLSVAPREGTKIVRISYESADPDLAATIANTVADQYITSYLDRRLGRTARATEWLAERVAELGSTLEASERALLDFKRENGLVDLGGNVERLDEQELMTATAGLAEARAAEAAARQRYQQVRAAAGDTDRLLGLPAAQSNPFVQRLKLDEAQAAREIDTLLTRYGQRHPSVLDAQSKLDTIRRDLASQLARVAGSVEQEYREAQQRLAAAESQLDIGKEEIQQLGAKRVELEALEREVQTNLGIYETFYARMTEARSTDGLEATNASVSDYAVPASAPFRPRTALIVGLISICTLLLASLSVLLRDYLNTALNGAEDVERSLGVSVVGVLPKVRGPLFGRRKKRRLHPRSIRDGAFFESINEIRTTLGLTDKDRPRKVILITSSVPAEGKSSLALNLAYSFGQVEHVLLVDGDLRRPTLERLLGKRSGTSSDRGLGGLIAGLSDPDAAIEKGRCDGAFDFLPAGPIPDQPLELLGAHRLERLIDELCTRYDRIVIDSAPVKAVSDALVLGRLADAIVYTVKAHDTPAETVRRNLQKFASVGTPALGVVLTQLRASKASAHEGHYYYDAYHDRPSRSGSKRLGDRGRLVLSAEQLRELRSEAAPEAASTLRARETRNARDRDGASGAHPQRTTARSSNLGMEKSPRGDRLDIL